MPLMSREYSVSPEILKPVGRQLRIAHRMLDFAVSEVGLQRSGIQHLPSFFESSQPPPFPVSFSPISDAATSCQNLAPSVCSIQMPRRLPTSRLRQHRQYRVNLIGSRSD